MASIGWLSPIADMPSKCSTPAMVRREAFYFASQGQPLFAWLELPDQSNGHGVVLCAPLGYEQVHAHRTWRCLADALAAAGFAVMRFDYHGTGDSAGYDEDPDRLTTWLANMRDASRFLHDQIDCDKISLIGLRFGATLALQAAEVDEFDSLILWAPVVSGRHYVREMKALSLTATIKPPPVADAPNDIEAAGFVLTKQTADELSKIDLLKVIPHCRRALIVTRDDVAEDRRLLEHLSARGIAASQVAQPGYADMMTEPHDVKVPHQAIACAVDWLRAGAAANATKKQVPDWPHTSDAIVATGIRERFSTIGLDSNLVGIFCESMNPPAADLPLIVMLNAGAAYRVGPSRLSVLLARALAARGFRSLRLDLSGLGDNVPVGSEGANDSYAAIAFRDIEATLDYVRQNRPGERIVLLGLCSGAYFAFQSAVQIADPSLVESVLINPLTFFWKEGMTIDDSPTWEDQAADYYWRSAFKPSKWLKLLSGQTKIGIGGAFAQFWRRWQTRYQAQTKEVLGERPADHPWRDDLVADLTWLEQRRRALTCFFSSADPGYHIMSVRAKSKMQELIHAGKMSVTFIDDADHTFSFREPRIALIESVCDHLGRRYIPNP